jgi:mannose-1-phosphate guanylyltransferase
LGTRLRPLTLFRPKPLVPVCGVTVLEQALALCAHHGLRSAVVNAHHLAGQVEAFCAAYSGVALHVQVELPEILGTGGGLRAARDRLAERFAVVNGDVLCDGDLTALLADCAGPGVDASMLLRRSKEAAQHGIVAVDAAGRVVRLTSLCHLPGATAVDTHFTGVHALRRSALDRVPSEGFACVVRSAYAALVPEGRVRGRLHAGAWVDIGDPATYLAACLAVLTGSLVLPVDPWARAGCGQRTAEGAAVGDPTACDLHPTARLSGPCWIGRGAVVEADAVVGPGAVVGQGARIGRGAHLCRSVVWDGCAVVPGARWVGAVVHDGGVLVP